MRRILFSIGAIMLAAAGIQVQAQEDVDSPEYREAKLRETGGIDDSEVRAILDSVDSVSGMLDATDPTWDRIFNNTATTADLTCNLTSTDSGNDGQFYDAYQIQVTAAETLEAVISAGDFDTVMAIYCDPFDDANPMNNLIFYDDDGGVGTLSAFTAADGIDLTPGSTFWVVVSSFGGSGVTGTYTLDLTSPTVTIVPVELQSFSID